MSKQTKDRDAAETKPESRRALLSSGVSAASVLLGLTAIACGGDGGAAMGESPDTGSKPDAGRGKPSGSGTGDAGMSPDADADVGPLNELLSAEYNAITAYGAGAGLIMGATTTDPLYALRTVIVSIAVDFQAQHKLHAEALVEAIEQLGGTPVVESEIAAAFKPPQGLVANPSISNVLKFATAAERGAAVAYNQVLAGLEAAKLRQLASAIEGDESQHFIVLAALVLGLAAPGPKLNSDSADDVVPEAFATSVGDYAGLDASPPDYFG